MTEIEEQIINIINKIRPLLMSDGGNIEFIKYQDGICYVRLVGACAGCSMMDITLKDGIEALICSEIKEVKEVQNVPMF